MHHCLLKSPGSDLSGLSLFELTTTRLQAKKFIDILYLFTRDSRLTGNRIEAESVIVRQITALCQDKKIRGAPSKRTFPLSVDT